MAEELFPYKSIEYQRFNESLDRAGSVCIAGVDFYPSSILYEMDPILYREAYVGFQNEEFDRIKGRIYDEYPSCIAYHFRLLEKGEGAFDPVRKLFYLKDTWESIVFVLYALVWGEIRHKSIALNAVQINHAVSPDGNPVFRNLNAEVLMSDALKTKIQTLKSILCYSVDHRLALKCERIETELLDTLLSLQDIRNDLSHFTIPTTEEAEKELKQVIPLFKEMLIKTEFLAECRILRLEEIIHLCRCEEFRGHSLNKEYDEFDFGNNLQYVLGLERDQLFVKWDDVVFSLSPFLHFQKDDAGRKSYLSFYKRKKAGKYLFEPVTKREEVTFDHLQSRFEEHKNAILKLIISQ